MGQGLMHVFPIALMACTSGCWLAVVLAVSARCLAPQTASAAAVAVRARQVKSSLTFASCVLVCRRGYDRRHYHFAHVAMLRRCDAMLLHGGGIIR